MELKVKKHGRDYDTIEVKRPIKIVLSNGEEFEIFEEFNALVLRKIDGHLNIKPEYSNQVSVK